MRCQEIMKGPVVICSEVDTAQMAAKKMRDEGVGFLPICDLKGHVVGVLTDRDIAVRVCAEGLDPHETLVAQVMTRQIIACRPENDVIQAEALMGKNQKSRILIQDKGGRPVGVISLSDIARHDKVYAAEALRQVTSRQVRPD